MSNPSPQKREPKGLSLEIRLPLLITAVIAAVAVGIAIASYGEVRRSAEAALWSRMEGVANLATMSASTVEQRQRLMEWVADQPAVASYLRGAEGARDAALAALDTIGSRSGRLGPRFWTPDRRPIEGGIEAAGPPESGWYDRTESVPDTGGIGSLFVQADTAWFWWAVPVERNGRRLGWVADLRRLGTGNAAAVQSLLGNDIEIRWADAATGVWLSFEAEPLQPPAEWPFEGNAEVTIDNESWLATAKRIPGTSIAVVAVAPESAMMARPTAFRRWMSIAATLLVLAGALAGWLVSRRVTRPLRELDRASRAIAAGDLDQHVGLDRDDELGALGRSFDHMAAQLREARTALERQFGEARALASALSDTNTRLEDAITAADASRIEAQRASRAKSDFLATMSHEIRTPINAMLGYTDLLDVGVAGPLNDAQREQLGRIRASGRHLVSLIDEVLDLSGIESGRLRLEPSNSPVEEAAETALAIVRPQALAKPVTLELAGADAGVRYRGDRRRVEQILVNLLTNAVKFTPPGGTVTVSCCTATCDGGDWAEIVVRDTGIGIEPGLHEEIFEPFVQAETGYTRPHGGVGLGLAISRRLARMMGGDITVQSAAGKGASFTLRLPVGALEPEHARSA